jgi:cell division protein FtsB
MENLDSRVKDLSDENEQLKKENSKLLTRIHTLEMEVCFFQLTSKIKLSFPIL